MGGRHHKRGFGFGAKRAAQARAANERLFQKQQAATVKPPDPADVPKVRDTYRRMLDRIDADNHWTNGTAQ